MAIDLNSNKTYSPEELKSRAQSRLAAQGIGLAERLANVERIVYKLAGSYTPSTQAQTQIDAICAALIAEEVEYDAEIADNSLLVSALEYEDAEARLAVPPLDPLAVDTQGNLLYPDVLDSNGNPTTNPELVKDADERAAAQTIITGATTAVTTLVSNRATYRQSLAV